MRVGPPRPRLQMVSHPKLCYLNIYVDIYCNIYRYITNNTQLDDQGKPGPLGPDFGNYLYAFISSIIYIISQIMQVRLCP